MQKVSWKKSKNVFYCFMQKEASCKMDLEHKGCLRIFADVPLTQSTV